jgi:eukaryotic-like serine/threonine-protein kinase
MSAPGWEDIAAIADELLDLEVEQREAMLVARCGGDAALESAVRKLIGDVAKAQSREFLEQRVIPGDAFAAGLKGASIGGFDLIDALGEGGMGVVFKARQHKPERNVAVKVLRPAFATRSAVRRFEVESEILGRMEHSAIARVIASGVHRFEGGGLAFDLPWYAMELLEGARDLLSYARDEELSLDAKLSVFVRACEAVHHAHLRGVIHRDLKPGNILVDRNGDPKVIDFGIARATNDGASPLGVMTAGTSAFDLLGTLRYMAPEQVDGRADRVDVRTDVYALGIVLFELLTGASPLDVEESTLDEAIRAIRVAPPKRPTAIDRTLPRELDWVVDKCLAKEPDDRFDSVRALIDDLERFRRREILSVGPRDVSYRVRTFLRRNRLGVAIGTSVVVLLGGWIASLDSALERARTAESEASLRADEANREAEKLKVVRDYFGVAVDRARKSFGVDGLLFRHVLEQLEPSLASHDMPAEVAAVLAADIAGFHLDLDRPDRAIALLEPMLSRLEQSGLARGFEARRVHMILARARQFAGDSAAASEHIDAATSSRVGGIADGSQASETAALLVEWERVRHLIAAERFADAESLLRRLLEPFENGASDPMNNANAIRGGLVLVLSAQGHFDEAEPLAREALAEDRKIYGEGSVRAATAATMLAVIRIARGVPQEALALLDDALTVLAPQLPPTNRYVLSALEQKAIAKQHLGELEVALAILEDALPKRRGEVGRWDRESLLTVSRIGSVLTQMRRFDEAESRLLSAQRESEASLGADHPMRMVVAAEIGRVQVLAGRVEQGVAMIEESIRRLSEIEDESARVAKLRGWLERARNGTLTPDPG